MSIPAILGAVAFHAKDLLEGASAGGGIDVPLAAGTLVAMAVGIFAVKFTMKVIRERSMTGFAVYVGALGVLVLLDQFFFGFFF
jgi:undecaprenyl-diphosphatase